MTVWLKQSIAVTLVMGPFVDDTDGKTAEIALDITEQEVLLSKNGGAFTLKSETTHGVHDAAHNGWYTIPLDQTDTNTLGALTIAINMAGALPVWKECMVVAADAWSSLFGASVLGNAALVALSLDHLAAVATVAADMTAEVIDNSILARVLGNGDTSTFVPSTDGLHAAGVDLDAALTDIAAVHVHAGTIETDVAAVHVHAQTIETDVAAVHVHAGTIETDVAAILVDTGTTLETDIDAILADTNELQTDWVNGGRLDLLLDGASAPTAATVADAVWDEVLHTDHEVAGSASVLLQASGAAGDPWDITLPGAYGAGKAGKIVGDNINAPIATVDTVVDGIATDVAAVHVHAQTIETAVDTEVAAILAAVDTEIGALVTDVAAVHVHAQTIETDVAAVHVHAQTIETAVDTEIAAILTDTAELQTDWANGGRLDVLLDAAASQAGTGLVTCIITVHDGDGADIGAAALWITSDVGGSTVVASGQSNDTGTKTFYLDAGTYYVWAQKAGYTFTNPATFVVAA